ncbi:SRPBCC family protein [Zavarzinia sp. CC-PAN008]|uniref:SRPBCC family protein n=1 Tax=Zavarzinia sp. CC-PAN008 TaxID=3243332 RepID=UPI003F749909
MKVAVEEKIAAPADKVWPVISNFGGIEVGPGVEAFKLEGSGVGAVRTITLTGGAAIQERLEAHDDAKRSFSYAVINKDSPLPIANYLATVVVTPDGDGSKVHWSSTFDPVGISEAQAEAMIAPLYRQAIQGTRAKLGL